MEGCCPINDMLQAGIDDDIKLWCPTAEERKPVPGRASAVMQRNQEARNSSHMGGMSARRILMRLQRLAESREDE